MKTITDNIIMNIFSKSKLMEKDYIDQRFNRNYYWGGDGITGEELCFMAEHNWTLSLHAKKELESYKYCTPEQVKIRTCYADFIPDRDTELIFRLSYQNKEI